MNFSAAFWADPALWGCMTCGKNDDHVRQGHACCRRHALPPEGASDEEWSEWLMDAEVGDEA